MEDDGDAPPDPGPTVVVKRSKNKVAKVKKKKKTNTNEHSDGELDSPRRSKKKKKPPSAAYLAEQLVNIEGLKPGFLKPQGDATELEMRIKLQEKLQKDPMLEVFEEDPEGELDLRRKLKRKMERQQMRHITYDEERMQPTSSQYRDGYRPQLQSAVNVAYSNTNRPLSDYYPPRSSVAVVASSFVKQPIYDDQAPLNDYIDNRHYSSNRGDYRGGGTSSHGYRGGGPTRGHGHGDAASAVGGYEGHDYNSYRGRASAAGHSSERQHYRADSRTRSPSRDDRSSRYDRYSSHGDRSFDGSDHHRSDDASPSRKEMPEHLKWLHERWRKYDRTFFDQQPKTVDRPQKGPTPAERQQYRRQMQEFRKEKQRQTNNKAKQTGGNTQPLGPQQPPLTEQDVGTPFYEYRADGGQPSGVDYSGRMCTFKEFLMFQANEFSDQDAAMHSYNEYKLEFRKRCLADFFQAHSEDEWFLEMYHPMLKAKKEARRREKVRRRLDVFMQLLVRGWMECSLDLDDSRKIRKLMDAVIVLLEGGDEGDIGCLNDLEYVLEEKKEQSHLRVNPNIDDESSDDEEKKGDADGDEEEEGDPEIGEDERALRRTIGKAPGSKGRTVEEQAADEQEGQPTAVELERMIHAKDYRLYNEQHGAGPDLMTAPDQVDLSTKDGNAKASTSTFKPAKGVFLAHTVMAKPLEEMNLHKVSAILMRNVPPTVSREEVETMCGNAHGGYLRTHLTEPDPNAHYYRQAIISYWFNANITKIMWKLRGQRLRDIPMIVIEYREFARRIDCIDGVCGDKSVVLRDIQLCKSLIEYMDRRNHLWGNEPNLRAVRRPRNANNEPMPHQNAPPTTEPGEHNDDGDEPEPGQADLNAGGPPKINPLLVNLDQCLSFHLHQLMQQDENEKDAISEKIDHDPDLSRILDRLVLYLRIVHSIDYYGCKWYELEDDEPRRLGTVTLRGEPSKMATPKRLAKYIKRFEERLKCLLPQERRLANEHVEILGKRSPEVEVEKFINANVISVVDGMSKCCLCYKRFTSHDFAVMHMHDRHPDKLEEVKWVVFCFNSYLADPGRPCPAQFSASIDADIEQKQFLTLKDMLH